MQGDLKRIIARFYKSSKGNEPVRKWLLQLSKEDKKTVGADIKTIEYGWPIGMPISRPLRRGLYEVRSTLQNSIPARVIFCVEENTMILLHAFIKKTQTTPDKDIDLALQRRKEIMKK